MPRFMTLIHLDESNQPAEGHSAELGERMGQLAQEMEKAGAMLETGGLHPSAEGTRVTWSGGKLTVTDGPFTESKEVIGGYSIVQAKTQAEAVEWAKRFLQIHEDYWTLTAETRQIAE